MIEQAHARRAAPGPILRGWLAVSAVTLCSTLPGCAVVAAYHRCGTAGCPGDADISTEVRRLFRQHPGISPPNLIDVQTIDRVVYLYGVVDTEMEQQLAGAVASEAHGVKRVVNAIGLNNESR